jgi:hypothetical protein
MLDLNPPRVQVRRTGMSSRPPRRWLRQDPQPELRAIQGATALT